MDGTIRDNVEEGAEVDGLDWLMHRIDDREIKKLLGENPDDFLLFIGHQPDVAEHTGLDKKTVKNCEVFAKDFSVRRPSKDLQ